MIAEFITSQRTDHGVPHAVSWRALDVAPSTFYKHLNRPPTDQQVRRQATDAEVKRAFGKSEGTYGSPRVRAQLRRDGISVSKKTVEASMARQGLCARPKKKKGLTSQNPGAAAPSDLVRRDFSASGVNQKWCGDIKGVIFHPDKGTQYTAGEFAKACRRLGIARSTGRTGNALDNAPAESFFSTLQPSSSTAAPGPPKPKPDKKSPCGSTAGTTNTGSTRS